MAELIIKDTDKIFFLPGEQKCFLLESIQKFKVSQRNFADILEVSTRTLSDWIREKYPLSYGTAKKIQEKTQVAFPVIKEVRDKFWYTKIGAKKGGITSYAKYKFGNNEKYRQEQWKKWWEEKGRHESKIIGKVKPFTLPKKSEVLAEFVGILIGDGGITPYQIKITLDSETDKLYLLFVSNLIQNMFGVVPSISKRPQERACVICLSRKSLVEFFLTLGLKVGNKIKQNVDIPKWIMDNAQYQRACVRGLIDTDGCLVIETHTIKNKKYQYPRINFTSASSDLIHSVFKILHDNNLSPIIRRRGQSVQLENNQKICDYFKAIGTSNPKHLERWHLTNSRRRVRVVEGNSLENCQG